MRGAERAAAVVLAAALGAGLLVACGGDETPGAELETVDVAPPPELDLSADPVEPPRRPALSGVLPADFPDDLPLHLPASLVDFGPAEGGRRSVSLLTSNGLGATRADLERRLRAAGWTVSGGDGRRVLTKGGRTVVLRLADDAGGTLYRFEY